MHNDDERDFEEEADNLRTMQEVDEPDESDEAVIREGMCQTVETAQFYGYDQGLPCLHKAAFTVKYQLFIVYDADTHETDFWVDCAETVCDTHRGHMVTWAEEHPKEMQITSVALLPGIKTVLPERDILDDCDIQDMTDDCDNCYFQPDWDNLYNLPHTD